MVRISIGNSVSSISGMDQFQHKSLAFILSYLEKTMFSATRRFLLKKDLTFPTGLVQRVFDFFRTREYQYDVSDVRLKPRPAYLGLTQTCPEPVAYAEQQLAVLKCLESIQGRGIITMPTGVGKTRCIKDLIVKVDVPTLVVTPSTNLKRQTAGYLSECFGDQAVGTYSRYSGMTHPVMVANVDSLEQAAKYHFEKIGMVVIDEFHHCAARTYREINEKFWNNVYYRFGFTATNFRNDPTEKILLESVLSEELYCMTPIEGITKGYIVPVKPIIYNIHNTHIDDRPQMEESEDVPDVYVVDDDNAGSGQGYAEKYRKYIVDNLERNQKIAEVANQMVENGILTLILVRQIDHGKYLNSAIKGSVFVNGLDEDFQYNMRMVDKFNAGAIRCLIGTSVLGEGVDTKAAECVILASGEKAESRVMQNVGRVVRNYPGKKVGYVVDFFDFGDKTITKHSRRRMEIYKKVFGSEIITM